MLYMVYINDDPCDPRFRLTESDHEPTDEEIQAIRNRHNHSEVTP